MKEKEILFIIKGRIIKAKKEGLKTIRLPLPMPGVTLEELTSVVEKIQDIKKAYVLTKYGLAVAKEEFMVIEW